MVTLGRWGDGGGRSWSVHATNYDGTLGITWGKPGPSFSGFNAVSYVFNFFRGLVSSRLNFLVRSSFFFLLENTTARIKISFLSGEDPKAWRRGGGPGGVSFIFPSRLRK
jgi:hypothetical protein